MANSNFKVIISGGGPVGLYMAHALDKANIDFLVLEERPEIIRHAGAGTALLPGAVRLLDQVGVLEHIQNQIPLFDKIDLTTDNGAVLRQFGLFDSMEECLGYRPTITSRKDLIEGLFTTLPDRETRVRPNSKVVDVKITADGVVAYLKNGTVVEGSILIGCDGVHSITRSSMQQLREDAGESVTKDEAKMMKTTYSGIYGRIDNASDIVANGTAYEARGTGWFIQLFGGGDHAWYAVMKTNKNGERSTEPLYANRGHRYTIEERDALAEESADLIVTPEGRTFRDIWDRTDKESAVMVNQEQGNLDKWHFGGRIAIVGDSQMKITSATGSGFLNGALTAATLANELHDLLVTVPAGEQPTVDSLDAAFTRFQKAREDACTAVLARDRELLERVTWSSWWVWLMDRWVLRPPWVDFDAFYRKTVVPLLVKAPLLTYVPYESKVGSVPWTFSPQAKL